MHWFVFVKKCSFATIFRPQYIEELLHFLKLFIDNKSESLLLLVCVCDALWEAEATYTVGKAVFFFSFIGTKTSHKMLQVP